MNEDEFLDGIIDEIIEDIESIAVNEVAQKMKEIEQEVIYEEVYKAYLPTSYKRRYESNGLSDMDNMELEHKTDKNGITLELYNMTKGNERYKKHDEYISDIIETGEGYRYVGNGDNMFERPRPFQAVAENILVETDEIIDVIYEGLEKRGYGLG